MNENNLPNIEGEENTIPAEETVEEVVEEDEEKVDEIVEAQLREAYRNVM